MAAMLVFVLAMLGVGLLIVGERMGLVAPVGVIGLGLVLCFAVIALGFSSVTSRFSCFIAGVNGTGEAPQFLALVAPVVSVLVLMAGFLPQDMASVMLWAGFALGYLLAQGLAIRAPDHSLAARFARLMPGLAIMALCLYFYRHIQDSVVQSTGWPEGVVMGGLAACLLAVLLPGGMRAIGRLQGFMLGCALVLVIVPFLGLGAMVLAERADPIATQALDQFLKWNDGPLSHFIFGPNEMSHSTIAQVFVLLLGVSGGLAARGQAPASAVQALSALVLGLICVAFLVALHGLAEGWLAEIVRQQIVNSAPAQWPGFVFEDSLVGWLRACGVAPDDTQAAARACALAGPNQPIEAQKLVFLTSLSAPALSLANGLPILLGFLWGLMPALLGLGGLMTLLHAAGVAFSESVLFATFNPSGLRSWRLAMARMSILALVLALPGAALAGLRLTLPLVMPVFVGLMAIALGVTLFWLARPSSRVAPPVEWSA